MAHLFFCSRFWCTFKEEDKYEMVKCSSELIVGEEK